MVRGYKVLKNIGGGNRETKLSRAMKFRPGEAAEHHASTFRRKLVISLYATSLVSMILVMYLCQFPRTLNPFQGLVVLNQIHVTNHNNIFVNSTGSLSVRVNLTPNTTTTVDLDSDLVHLGVEARACALPGLNPLDKSILQFVEVPAGLDCTNVQPKRRRPWDKYYHLLFSTDTNSNLIQVANISKFGFEGCCYKNFSRLNDDEYAYSRKICHPITSRITKISPAHEFIIVYCRRSPEGQEVVDMFNFIPIKPDVEERIERLSRLRPAPQLNVLVLGLDAVSHMNFIRSMPKTHAYLTGELKGIGMGGYTKVGDNTFPNIVPALSGYSVPELEPICWSESENETEGLETVFDACPLIWKDFSREGYWTAYAEDATWMGIFNYMKGGFGAQPTDYYLRTLTHPMARLIGHAKELNAKLCYGPRMSFTVLLENIKKLAASMGTEKRYFSFTWATALFHDFLSYVSLGDEELSEALKWLKRNGYLENTALILMSDHGIRWGDIRETFQGKIEERMPFLYYSFPRWFSEKYRSAVSNMKLNRDRLTSPFDFYETLKDLLHLNQIADEEVKERFRNLNTLVASNEMPRGISLFLPVPLRRDCDTAGIPYHYCVCHNMETISTKSWLVREAASAVVRELNEMLSKYPQCSDLTLQSVSNAQVMRMHPNSTNAEEFARDRPTRYSVTLSTEPGGAVFEATLVLDRGPPRFWTLAGDISRINLYGNQSRCVTDFNMKKYCFC